ncbi:YraN family protein [candidate division KSB1 bacterium]
MKKAIGETGEKIARKYIKKAGMKLLEKNFRALRGEIDIIAKDEDQLVFIEVKTNSTDHDISPEMRVNFAKQKQINKVAQMYIQQKNCIDMDCRFDVIGVKLHQKGKHEINHIKNAFWIQSEI